MGIPKFELNKRTVNITMADAEELDMELRDNAVLYSDSQNLSSEQQQQARENIGAIGDMAPQWTQQAAYNPGDLVMRNDKIYRALHVIASGTTWAVSDWEEVDLTDFVQTGIFSFLESLVNGIISSLSNGLPYLKVQELVIERKLDAYIKDGNALTSGAGAPTILPQFNGQEYFDTIHEVWYKASYTGTEPTAAAWKQITN